MNRCKTLSSGVLHILKTEDQVIREAEKRHFEWVFPISRSPKLFCRKDPRASSSVFLIQEVSYFLKSTQVKQLAQNHVYVYTKGRTGQGAAFPY